MRLPRFDFFAPQTLEAALRLLDGQGEGFSVMAGGTDLMVKMSHGRLKPKTIISLKEIPDLHYINFAGADGMDIGATALLSEVLASNEIATHYPALIEAVQMMANVEVRNMATVAGNLCNAAPSADSAPPLMVMGAVVNLASANSTRQIPLMDFFRGPGITQKDDNEIMTSIWLPAPEVNSGAAYKRISARCGVDIAAVGVGVGLKLESQIVVEASIVLGAVGPTPIRASKAEAALIGKTCDQETLKKASLLAAEEARPITDIRASADYRKKMVEVLTGRTISAAYERIVARQS